MLPGGQGLSTAPVSAEFLAPRDRPYEARVSYEFGGPALGVPAQSRLVRIWVAYYESGVIYVAPEDGSSAPVGIIMDPLVETVSLAFDQNMRATLAYMSSGTLKLWWFDSVANANVITTFGGATSGQVTCDDKRDTQVGNSDVIFVYTKGDALYYRMQRDRYTIEYLLAPVVKGKVLRIGMNVKNRLQFEVGKKEA